jgi:hypothetical protein
MNIYKRLEAEHSAECRDAIIEYVGNSKERFDELMECFLAEEWRICQRAAWPLGYIGRDHPELLSNYHELFIELLSKPSKHVAITRNILRIYEDISIPEDYQGRLFDVSMDLAMSTKQPIAVRAFSLGILANIAGDNPGLAEEILILLEEFPGELSAGLHNRLGKVRKRLQKLVIGL